MIRTREKQEGCKRKKWIIYKRNNAGATLVEMIVSFVLIGIFITAVCAVMSNTLRLYYRMKNLQQGEQVLEMVMDKVTGELWGAQVDARRFDKIDSSEDSENMTMCIMNSVDGVGDKIDFYDKYGNHVYITLKNGGVLVFYYEVKSEAQGESISFKNNVWTFDEKAYMNYEVTSLKFSQPGEANGYADNVIKVEATVTNQKDTNQTFDAVRYVECYNFTGNDVRKIGAE